eukprot:g3698.t1
MELRHALIPLLLAVNSVSIISIYSWFRVFDVARKAGGESLGAFWGICLAFSIIVTAAVFALTWRAELEVARERDDPAAEGTLFEKQLRRMLVSTVGKSAMLAAIFSTHFAILESLPVSVGASLGYMGTSTALVVAVVAAGNASSIFLSHCFCCAPLCRQSARASPAVFARAKTKTVAACIALVGNCGAWLLGMVYNFTVTRALAEAEENGSIGRALLTATKWLVSLAFFLASFVVIKLKKRVLGLCGGFDVHDMAEDIARTIKGRGGGAAGEEAEGGDGGAEDEDGDAAARFGFSELIDRTVLYTACFSVYRAIKYSVSPDSEAAGSTGELVASLESSGANFLVAALVVSALGTAGAIALERAVEQATAQGASDDDVIHLYDFVADFGIQGLAYIVGRLWYDSLTAWLDAKGTKAGVESDSLAALIALAVLSTVVGLSFSMFVGKLFKGHSLVRKRAAEGAGGGDGAAAAAAGPGAVGKAVPQRKLVV